MGIAKQNGTSHQRWLMPVNSNTWEVTDFDAGDEAWLVITAVDDNIDDGETHSYQFKITEPIEEQKGGCMTTNHLSIGWIGLMFSILGFRRR